MKVARIRRQVIESQISDVLKSEAGIELNEKEIKELFQDQPEKGGSLGKSVFQYQDLAPEIRKLFLQGKSQSDSKVEQFIISCE